MARATTKKDLIEASENKFAKLWEEIENLTEQELNTIFDFSSNPSLKESHWKRDKNVRDILIHLYEWQQLLINWIDRNQLGKSAKFLPEPYTFKTTPEMNIKFWERHQNTAYTIATEMLKNSHKEVMQRIESFSNEELFTKKYFSWTGTTSLGSYCVSGTASHYDWAIKKIKKHQNIFLK